MDIQTFWKTFSGSKLVMGLLLLCTLCGESILGQVQISEFGANSKGGMDWLELHNEGDHPFSMEGSFLTDSYETGKRHYLTGFADKPLILMPNAIALLWLGNPEDWQKGAYGYETGFDWRGEHIGLYEAQGELIDSLSYGLQFANISSGFKKTVHQKGRTLVYFSEPSPGIPNPSKAKAYRSYCKPPFFSVGSSSSLLNLNVALKSDEGRYSKIYYRLDGGIPSDTAGILYEGPITLNKSTVVRAVVYSLGKLKSQVRSEHFFIREPSSTLPTVSIAVGNWEVYQADLGKTDIEQAAHIQYYDLDGKKAFETNVALTLAGGGSRTHPQKSISLHVKSYLESERYFDYKLFPNKDHTKCKGFVLRNSGNAVPKTHLKDAFMQRLMSDNTSVDYLDSRPVNVYVNGQYWGLYNLREKKCRHYYRDNHSDLEGQLTVVDGFQNRLLHGYSTAFSALVSFVQENDLRSQANYEDVCNLVDIDNFIDYQIAQIFFANTDWPINNVRAWQVALDSSASKWRWVLFDLDHGFRANKAELNSLEYALGTNNFHSEDFDEALEDGTLFLRKLLDNPQFAARFVGRFADLFNSNLSVDNILYTLNTMVAEIEPEMQRHIDRWDDDKDAVHIKSMERWRRGIEDMKQFTRKRAAFLRPVIEEKFDLKGSFDLQVECSKGGYIQVNNLPAVDSTFHGQYFLNSVVVLKAIPKEGFEFLYWEGINNKGTPEVELLATDPKLYRIKALFQAIER